MSNWIRHYQNVIQKYIFSGNLFTLTNLAGDDLENNESKTYFLQASKRELVDRKKNNSDFHWFFPTP